MVIQAGNAIKRVSSEHLHEACRTSKSQVHATNSGQLDAFGKLTSREQALQPFPVVYGRHLAFRIHRFYVTH